MFTSSNFKEWFNRYKYAELSATTAVLLGSQMHLFFDGITTAYLITFAEYLAFYGVILMASYSKLIQKNRLLQQKTTWKEVLLLVRNLIMEFDYPSLLDFFFVRPFCMYWMPVLFGNYFTGIIAGKISADFVFYSLAILNYEFIKKKIYKH